MENNTKAAVSFVGAGLVAIGLWVVGKHIQKKLQERKEDVDAAP